jgi:hypothetical protein
VRLALATSLVVLAAVLGVACSGGDDIDIEGLVTRTPSPTASVPPTRAPETATPTPTETAPAATATTTATPEATPSPTATPTQARDGEQTEAEGIPFSTQDVREAVQGAGLSFLETDDLELGCSETAVPAHFYWTAGDSTDFGPAFALWVYPDGEAREQEWEINSDDRIESLVDGCDIGHGFVYWNANLVMAFAHWGGAGEVYPLSGHHEAPNEQYAGSRAIEAFLELAP